MSSKDHHLKPHRGPHASLRISETHDVADDLNTAELLSHRVNGRSLTVGEGGKVVKTVIAATPEDRREIQALKQMLKPPSFNMDTVASQHPQALEVAAELNLAGEKHSTTGIFRAVGELENLSPTERSVALKIAMAPGSQLGPQSRAALALPIPDAGNKQGADPWGPAAQDSKGLFSIRPISKTPKPAGP